MAQKADLEQRLAKLRLARQRLRKGRGQGKPTAAAVESEAATLRQQLEALDVQIAPLAEAASRIHNPHWGLLLRTGNDKSHLARQLERHADIYTSRVSNFLPLTPYAFLRSPRGTLPHDFGLPNS
jgi:hypothetical protein